MQPEVGNQSSTPPPASNLMRVSRGVAPQVWLRSKLPGLAALLQACPSCPNRSAPHAGALLALAHGDRCGPRMGRGLGLG